jgi:hypothetical protein
MLPTFSIGGERYLCPYWDLLPPLSESEREELRTSIQESGIQSPIILSPEREGLVARVVDGYHRLLLAVELGLPKVPTKYLTAPPVPGKPTSAARLTPEAEREMALTLNLARRHLSPEQRRALVQKLRAQGMSQRAIAQTVGVDVSTINRDLRGTISGVAFATPEMPSTPTQPATIKGRDGKEYPAAKPKPAPLTVLDSLPPPEEDEDSWPPSATHATDDDEADIAPEEERAEPFPVLSARASTPTTAAAPHAQPAQALNDEGDESEEGGEDRASGEGLGRCDECGEKRVLGFMGGLELCPACMEEAEREHDEAPKKEETEDETPAKERAVYLRSGRQDWNTPPEVLALIRGIDVIALDPCSNEHSLVDALVEFDAEDDGLAQDWLAEVFIHQDSQCGLVFVNPPFEDSETWARKCAEEAAKGCEVVLLTPARVGSAWYHEHVFARAQAVCFPKGRLHFYQDGMKGGAATFDTAIAYFGPNPNRFARSLETLGACLNLQAPLAPAERKAGQR